MSKHVVYELSFPITSTQAIPQLQQKLDKWIFELEQLNDTTIRITLPINQGRDVDDFEEDIRFLFSDVTINTP